MRNPQPTAFPRETTPWLFSPTLDLLVGCGAWSLPLLVATFFYQREHAIGASFAFYFLAVFCNNPHYMATIFRAYHTREDFNKYRFFTVYVTVLLGLTVVLVHLVPGLFPWVVTLYLTWSPWHYTGQNFGIAQLMIRRGGSAAIAPGKSAPAPDPIARQLLYASYVTSFGVWLLTLHTARDLGDPYFISLGIPEIVAAPLQLFFTLTFLGCAGAAFVRLSRQLPRRALIAPATLTITQLLWFVAPALMARFGGLALPASYFSAGALAFMHCAQYLWITSYFTRREAAAKSSGAKSSDLAPSRFSFGRYYFMLIVGGIALFVPGPWIASRVLGHDFLESFMIFLALVNLHHFILDGAIWKLRDGRIARLLLGRRSPDPEPGTQASDQAPSLASHLGWLFGASRAARFTRYALGGGILMVGALDQWQFLSTTRAADPTTLARAAAVNPHDPRPAFRRAQQLAATGDIAGARRELAPLISANPRNAAAQHLLGELLFRSGDTAGALAHYDRMAQLFRPDLAIATNRGLLAAASGRPADAVARFEEALRFAPHKTELHFLLAEVFAQENDSSRAIAQYELFTALADEAEPADFAVQIPRYVSSSLKLGEFYFQRRDFERAEHWFRRAADVSAVGHRLAETSVAFARLAVVQDAQGKSDAAVKSRGLSAQAQRFAR